MASQVLSGANNASYTNNTGQNVRLVINYMGNVTSMTWAGVTTTTAATTIGRSIPNTIASATNTEGGSSTTSTGTTGTLQGQIDPTGLVRRTAAQIQQRNAAQRAGQSVGSAAGAVIQLAPTTSSTSFSASTTVLITESNTLPTELMLANTQTFSAVCGAYNIVAIKEDGT